MVVNFKDNRKKIIILTIVLLSFYLISNSYAEIMEQSTVAQTSIPEPTIQKPIIQIIEEGKDISLSWNTVDNANEYILEKSTDGTHFNQIARTTDTHYTESNLEEGNYYYRVKAIGEVLVHYDGYFEVESGGEGITWNTFKLGMSPASIILKCNMYSVPDELKVYYDGSVIAETGVAISGTRTLTFQYNPQSGGPYEIEVEVIGQNYGTVWNYNIEAPPFDMMESGESTYSNVVNATIIDPKLWVFWPEGGQDVEVDWECGYIDVDGYLIELFRRDTVLDNWIPVKTIKEKDSFIWHDSNVTAGLNYKYQIRVFNLSKWEWDTLIESNWAELERPFSAPGGLRILNKTETNATVIWKPVEGAGSYLTEVSTNNGNSWQSNTVSSTSTTVPKPCLFKVKAGTHARSQYSGILTVQ